MSNDKPKKKKTPQKTGAYVTMSDEIREFWEGQAKENFRKFADEVGLFLKTKTEELQRKSKASGSGSAPPAVTHSHTSA